MANSGYDVVVDVDDEGDLGHTDLADLEFHPSSASSTPPPSIPEADSEWVDYDAGQASGKIPSNTSSMFSSPEVMRELGT